MIVNYEAYGDNDDNYKSIDDDIQTETMTILIKVKDKSRPKVCEY